MNSRILPLGTRIALGVRNCSPSLSDSTQPLSTLKHLLDKMAESNPPNLAMLKTASSLLCAYLQTPATELSIDDVNDAREGFRPYLESRRYAENSIRSYVNLARILLNAASQFGWKPGRNYAKEWIEILSNPDMRKCATVARQMARAHKHPRDVSIEDVDRWGDEHIRHGFSSDWAKKQKGAFWRLLKAAGVNCQFPISVIRGKGYGVALKDLPDDLRAEVIQLLKWKQDLISLDRPKYGRHRPITALCLKNLITSLFGFALNVRGMSNIGSLSDLFHKEIVSDFAMWRINERGVQGYTLQTSLGMLYAALRHNPRYTSLNLNWFTNLVNNLAGEMDSRREARKDEKFLEYRIVEEIPKKIQEFRASALRENDQEIARLVMHELLMRWLISLPWRQRNIRECRIAGPDPNLFKAKISSSRVDKPQWVQQLEQTDSDARFWQFRFSRDETKTRKEIHALVPRPLVCLLEQYLDKHRSKLVGYKDPGTLFVNNAGNAMSSIAVNRVVSELTLRHGGRRVTPHLFRDIVAFAWLKDHPKDYLSLSKILWHSNINTTIKIYGSRFNESSGVCAMESWLEEREEKAKAK